MLRNWKFFGYVAALPVIVAAAVATQAYTPIPVEFEELARQAELVVVGRVAKLESRFNDDGTMILTHATLEIDEAIVGEVAATLEIAEYGGRVGDRAMRSSAQVLYEQGERVLVFVCRDALDLMRTCGAHQGRMDVQVAAGGTLEAAGLMAGESVRGSLSEVRARVLDARGRSK